MWSAFIKLIFLLVCQGATISAQGGGHNTPPTPCSDPKSSGGVWQEGCLIKTCKAGAVEESLADECVQMIEDTVVDILEDKLAEKGIEHPTEAVKSDIILTVRSDEGILISGGDVAGTSVEYYNPNYQCRLPSLDGDGRTTHTMDGVTLCGSHESRTNCITFDQWGRWGNSHYLSERRVGHTSWNNKEEGKIILMGGYFSGTTTETIRVGQYGVPGFNLKYDTKAACSIPDHTTVIITGGEKTLRIVSRYSTSGHLEDLPSLNQGRRSHGCGAYTDDSGQQVFLVAGGQDDKYHKIASTEMLTRTSSAWVMVNNLPRKLSYLRGVTLGGVLYMTGGHDGDNKRDEILQWTGLGWEEVGKMKEARANHAVSTIRLDEIKDFCT